MRQNSKTVSKRQQVLNQVALFLLCQSEREASVIVIDNVHQSRKAAIVEEATFLVREQARQW